MPGAPKTERIRDPVHDLINFDQGDQFERVLWNVIQSRPFQRLRRIRQLGFSEYVYPGATHTRFAHSVGVFHTARRLTQIIERHLRQGGHDQLEHQRKVALAATLVHDLGHGMFSHAFEDVRRSLNLKLADHEHVSDLLIRNGEVADAFRDLGSGFANDVADVIQRGRPGNLYDAVVSSQFDADRLDYMQRDRLMAGVQGSSIDFTWLIANLEVGVVKTGVDELEAKPIETFVLGPKAVHAAEAYVLALFQLYPTVYFHKTTLAAERVFSALMLRVFELARNGQVDKTSLGMAHPLIRFAREPEKLEWALALDDSVLWGSLPMLVEADDQLVREFSQRLLFRQLPKCADIQERLRSEIAPKVAETTAQKDEQRKRIDQAVASIEDHLKEWSASNSGVGGPRILIARGKRDPYKRFQDSKGPLNQIRIKGKSGEIFDLAEVSPIVGAIESFEFFRAYYDESDGAAKAAIEDAITGANGRNQDA